MLSGKSSMHAAPWPRLLVVLGSFAHAHALAGSRSDAEAILEELLDEAKRNPQMDTTLPSPITASATRSATAMAGTGASERGVGTIGFLVPATPALQASALPPRFRRARSVGLTR